MNPSPALTHRRPTRLPEFLYGSAYYPEHWEETVRAADADPLATNTRETPDCVVPRPAPKPGSLPPLS